MKFIKLIILCFIMIMSFDSLAQSRDTVHYKVVVSEGSRLKVKDAIAVKKHMVVQTRKGIGTRSYFVWFIRHRKKYLPVDRSDFWMLKQVK